MIYRNKMGDFLTIAGSGVAALLLLAVSFFGLYLANRRYVSGTNAAQRQAHALEEIAEILSSIEGKLND